ncbi:hypothetical protein EV356DRAFT_506512 [Viridothelium virens]|uniref:rRNA methyltransferase 1, mitochondrial n=1 Tax=Viridothelium virens TaxID=1048519 RepID=A0A6A6H0T5_VIRVR|nr:hypothetical protein EV356DRAFT_506512 [Viridothelium virens]
MKYISALRSPSLCINCLLNLSFPSRTVSTLSAIGNALRESRKPLIKRDRDGDSRTHKNIQTPNKRNRPSLEDRKTSSQGTRPIASSEKSRFSKNGRTSDGRRSNVPRDVESVKTYTADNRVSEAAAKRTKNDLRKRSLAGEGDRSSGRSVGNHPDSYWGMPYTTAASEFLFGYSTVVAALKAQKRKFYKLYLHERAVRRDAGSGLDGLFKLVKETDVKVHQVNDSFLGVMDRKAKDRPHNGLILEASPLPIMPVVNLSNVARHESQFSVDLDFQSAEEKAINGTDPYVKYATSTWRNPFILFLYEIKNEGNLGAIIRTAYFLGVDAVAIHDRATASISSGPALKASSGAAEALPIFRVGNVDSFLSKSAEAGWRIFASVAPSATRLPDPATSRVSLTPSPSSPLGFSSTKSHIKDSSDSNEADALALAAPLDPLEALSPSPGASDPNDALTVPAVSQTPTKSPLAGRNKRPIVPFNSLGNPTLRYPSLLVLGGEQEGLSRRVLNKCHVEVCIESARNRNDIGVDSLNVSVAAGLLVQRFVARPKGAVRVGLGAMVG